MKWEMVRMNELCDIVRGSSPRPKGDPRYYGGEVPRLMIEDLTRDGKFVIPKVDSLTKEGALLSRPMQKGDLVITASGRPGVPAILNIDACIHDGFVGIRNLNKKVDSNFLYWFLLKSKDSTNDQSVGAIFKNLTTDQIKDLQIPLPPLATQKRIAAILDAADALRRKDQALLQKYDELAQAIFVDMFGDPVKNEKGWEVKKIGDITDVGSGGTPSRDVKEYYGGQIPWVKTTEVNGGIITFTEESITENALKNSNCKLYPKDSVIIAMYGQGKTRGQVALLGIEATTNQACGVIKPCKVVNPFYLFSYFKLQYKELRKLGRGGNQENLNSGMIKNFEIMTPPIELQILFEKRIDFVRNQAILLEKAHSETLFQSLLQKAFNAELVP